MTVTRHTKCIISCRKLIHAKNSKTKKLYGLNHIINTMCGPSHPATIATPLPEICMLKQEGSIKTNSLP